MKRRVMRGWTRVEKASGFFPFVLYPTRREAEESFALFYNASAWKAMRVEVRLINPRRKRK